jgi:CDP-diacylglycerol--serine O-phosphatidyltransferase
MFIRLGPRRQEFPLAALIPNLLTTLALCCGLAALHFATKPDWDKALGAVVLAGIFDALDGRAARLLRVTSGFGAILDSLSDFLSFGVAPAFILHAWIASQEKLVGRLGAFALAGFVTYALCAALRLARFTAEAPVGRQSRDKPAERPATYFTGMPSPAAAGAVLIPPMLARSDTVAWTAPAWAVIAYTLVIAVLMVTRLPMFSLKALRLSRRAVAPLLVGVGLLTVAATRDPWLTLSCISALYLLSIPVTIITRRMSRQPAEPAGQGPAPTAGEPAAGQAPRS